MSGSSVPTASIVLEGDWNKPHIFKRTRAEVRGILSALLREMSPGQDDDGD